LTLVELIVVIAIIVLLIGVSVPGIVSLTSLGRADFGNSARNLFGALRASKMYSATYRSVSAVAYVYAEAEDSVVIDPLTGAPQLVPVIEGFAMVRKAVDRQEALKLAQVWLDEDVQDLQRPNRLDDIVTYFDSNNVYFVLQNQEGRFRKFGRDAVILSLITEEIDMVNSQFTRSELRDSVGMSLIRIIDPSTWQDIDEDDYPDLIEPHVPMSEEAYADPAANPPPTLFPAHVFSPSGPMRVGGAAPERIEIEIGPSPSLADTYRFSRELTQDERDYDVADETGELLAEAEIVADRRFALPIIIELYQSTGRVKMASEGM
jgi:hypothetical protein